MRRSNCYRVVSVASKLILISVLVSGSTFAQQEKILHYFGSGQDGTQMNAGIVSDASGNIYGSTTGGGYYQNGVVFELSPQADGTWAESILYSFGPPAYGYLPNAQVTLDTKGNIYGTTTTGGAYNIGTVYKLSRNSEGQWIPETLLNFNATGGNAAGGSYVVVDNAGNVYGSNWLSGAYGYGFVFQLTRTQTGEWTENILENFKPSGKGGYYPGNLILDTAGNVYGVASGGPDGGGLVFRLSPSGTGWNETIVHSFSKNGAGGGTPTVIAFDSSGNLYGLTLSGGNGYGVAFKLTPSSHGSWTEEVIYNFGAEDGSHPSALLIDAFGNLYGTMVYAGPKGFGTIFRLSPETKEKWTVTHLHNFATNLSDGIWPYGTFIVDSAGNLYGSTGEGGFYGGGMVYEIIIP